MNIISGRFKGYKINTSFNSNYRPTKSMVRKSLFDKLKLLQNKKVLDLFSGTGVMGFEASSRGSDSIIFVENNRNAIKLLKNNIKKFSEANYEIYNMDCFEFLKKPFYFDLIFADPPYGVYDLKSLTKLVLNRLNFNGIFILECDKRVEPFFDAIVSNYGRTRLLSWEKK
jgi:16S rRNA (guanine966-N2)-methyltransferase